MMHMTFYWSKEVTLLFDSWKTKSLTAYALTLLACVVVSAFYQYLENLRVRLKLLSSGNPSPSEIETPLLQSKFLSFGSGKWSAVRFAGAALFGLNSAIGYLLMLSIMSFNGGVFVAVVVGLTLGYLVFRSGNDNGSVVVDNPCACA